MIPQVVFESEAGSDTRHRVQVYALSTCGFCKRAMAWLKDRGHAFEFVYVDLLQPDVKLALKEALRKRFETNLIFPFIIVDDSKNLAGFSEEQWKELLR